MKFTHDQYARALYEALHEVKTKDHDRVIDNFIAVLKAKGDIREYAPIIEIYEELDRKEKEIEQVEVTTAGDIEVNAGLLKQLNVVAGKNIEVKKKIDENLIGGVVIKVEDTLIDGSIKEQLASLKRNLSN